MPRFQTFCADVTRLYREHYWLAASSWLRWAALVAAQRSGAALWVNGRAAASLQGAS